MCTQKYQIVPILSNILNKRVDLGDKCADFWEKRVGKNDIKRVNRAGNLFCGFKTF
jgi:hypothetical protein